MLLNFELSRVFELAIFQQQGINKAKTRHMRQAHYSKSGLAPNPTHGKELLVASLFLFSFTQMS
jgi:hypothetical protein